MYVMFRKKRREYKGNRKVKNRPSYDRLLKEINDTNYSAVGRKYEVSDTAVRKWVKYYEKELK